MLAPVTHVLALANILRERRLPVPGEVRARLNARVAPTDIVAEAHWSRDHLLIDVARTFNVSAKAADKLIRCKQGDQLPVNATVANSSGMFGREIRTPRAGRVVVAGGGQVLLEVSQVEFQLKAGLSGTVTQIIPERGVVIQTYGSLIQGVWGNGRIEMGTMASLMEKPDSLLEVKRLDPVMRGTVILGGMCHDPEVLHTAAEMPVRGLILSSLLPALVPLALQMKYPIVVLGGFGSLPMNSAPYRLLTTNVKREVTVNAEAFDRYSGARPEVIIPLQVQNEPPEPRDTETFAPGQLVRLRSAPLFGGIATLINVLPGLTTLPSGLRAPAAEIRTEGGAQILVPLVNLEVVG